MTKISPSYLSVKDIEMTLSLFSSSDLIFLSYGEEVDGEYLPHSKALRIKPEISSVVDAINHTPLLPNDFGIMPFAWKGEDEKVTRMLLERKLTRWSEGELFAYGHLVIDRLLIDLDYGELTKENAYGEVEKLKELGIGKVAYTGGGLLAVVELEEGIEVKERETFNRLRKLLVAGLKELLSGFPLDEGSLNAGKGVRLIGTYSRKRELMTEWLLWEEGKKFDVFGLMLGIEGEVLSKAPSSLKEGIRENLGIEIPDRVEGVSVEKLFLLARDFYGDIDGQRNDFMLFLSSLCLEKGVEKERCEELYYEHLADLEKREKPYTRVKQTIDYVYREGKKFSLKVDVPESFRRAVSLCRGESVSLEWNEWVKEIEPTILREILSLAGVSFIEDGENLFFFVGEVFTGELFCEYLDREEGEDGKERLVKKKGKVEISVYLNLTPCLRKSLLALMETTNGETEWLIRNLLQVSYLVPSDLYEIKAKEDIVVLIDNPLVEAIKLIAHSKGLSKEEVRAQAVKKQINKEDTGFGLVRCMNPLLKRNCSDDCPYARFKNDLPHVVKRYVDVKTGKVQSALIRVDGEDIEVQGEVLENYRRFASYLEKRGIFLSSLVKEWLYQDVMKGGEVEYRDEEKEKFVAGINEFFSTFTEAFTYHIEDGYLWLTGSDFLEVLRFAGLSIQGKEVKKLKEKFGLKGIKTEKARYTLIPLSFFEEETLEIIKEELIQQAENQLLVAGVEGERKEEITQEDLEEEDYVLGRKAYIVPEEEGVRVSFMGEEKLFIKPADAGSWLRSVRAEKEREEIERMMSGED